MKPFEFLFGARFQIAFAAVAFVVLLFLFFVRKEKEVVPTPVMEKSVQNNRDF